MPSHTKKERAKGKARTIKGKLQKGKFERTITVKLGKRKKKK